MTVGERIKQIREEKKISQTELAEAINTTKQNIYKYENNIISNIPSDKIEAIAKYLSVSPAYLMGWDKSSNKKNDENFTTDSDIRRIERARKNMPQIEKDKMMKIVEAAFPKYFNDDFVDEDTDE